jgi:nitrite reductase/ring-hydroxylating ferredoxin subunit
MTGAALQQASIREQSILVIIALASVIVAAGVLWLVWPRPVPGVLRATTLDQLPPGSAISVELDATFRDPLPPPIRPPHRPLVQPSPVPVILHNDRGVVRAFYQRDPRSSCMFPWQQPEQLFIDPCHGSAYRPDGTYLRGPSARDLDQFGVIVRRDGSIWVDLNDFRPGQGRH